MKTGVHRKTHIDVREVRKWVVGLLRHFLFLFVVLSLAVEQITSELGRLKQQMFMILYTFCELGIWEWLSWEVLSLSFS